MRLISKFKQLFVNVEPEVKTSAPIKNIVGTELKDRNQTTNKKPPRSPKKKTPKKKKEEPKVEVVNFEFNPKDPKLGSIELDWNKEFVDLLRINGYLGLADEDVVNRWLSDVCRNIAMADLEDDNVRFIQRKNIGGGKTEIS
jgi:hypothetical protein